MPPLHLPEALAPRRQPLPIEPRTGEYLRGALAGGALTPAAAEAAMIAAYRDFVIRHFRVFAEFLRLIARPAGAPAIFHCTAGKDRTGFAAALLLTALGVPREEIERDYLATNALWRPDAAMVGRVPEAARHALFTANRAYLAAALAELAERHGGAELFVRDALGGRRAHAAWLDRCTE